MAEENWVWFDLDDTLHDFSYSLDKATSFALKKIAERLHLPLEQAQGRHQRVLEHHQKIAFADGRGAQEYRRERFTEAMGGNRFNDGESQNFLEEILSDYEGIYMNSLKLKPGAIELLKDLREKKYRLAILTNGPQDVQISVTKKLGLIQFFEKIYTSGSLKQPKSKGMFPNVLAQLNLSPRNVTMIGDSVEQDVKPALAEGISTIWFNEKNLTNEWGCGEVKSLGQISSVIK